MDGHSGRSLWDDAANPAGEPPDGRGAGDSVVNSADDAGDAGHAESAGHATDETIPEPGPCQGYGTGAGRP